MGITTRWADEAQTILDTEFVGEWDERDFRAAMDEIARILHDVDRRVDGIYDFRRSAARPANPFALVSYARYRLPHRGGLMVFVGGSARLQHAVRISRRIYRDLEGRAFAVNTLEEAHALIAEQRGG